ncbi:MAG: HAD hydrolase-like protein, partial [Rhizobacter sp.]
PGMVEQIGDRYGLDLTEVPLVGDSLRDLQAAVAAGAQPHLVRTGKGARLSDADVAEMARLVPGTQVHADLAEFAEHLIEHERERREATGKGDSGDGRLD